MGNLAVQIKNYQILENAKLEFEDGLNIIIGPSNNGKSAIIRAIEALIYNKAGNSFIRSGTNSAAVAIKTEDNHVIIWQKSSDEGIYKVDGQTYNKIGRGQLTEVADILRISEISINDEKVRINFLKQMEYPFLLDKNPSQLFSFLSMSNDGDRLTDIFTNMRSDLKKTNSSIDTVLGKIDVYNEQITREKNLIKNYEGIDDLHSKVLSYDSKAQRITRMRLSLDNIKALKEKLITLRNTILKLREIRDKLNLIYGDLDAKVEAYSSMQSNLISLKGKRTDLIDMKKSHEQLSKELTKYDDVLSNIDITRYSALLTKVEEMKKSYSTLDTLSVCLLREETTYKTSKESLERTEEELSQFDVCPLCGQLLPHSHE